MENIVDRRIGDRGGLALREDVLQHVLLQHTVDALANAPYPVTVIGGADLAHVGRRFGDPIDVYSCGPWCQGPVIAHVIPGCMMFTNSHFPSGL